MATQKLYPRGTVKHIVKAHANRSLSKNADILVCIAAHVWTWNPSSTRLTPAVFQIFLDYMLFMQECVGRFCSIHLSLVVKTAQGVDYLDHDEADLRLRLMREASIRSRRAGEKSISANAIRKVTEVRASPSPSVSLAGLIF